MQPNAFERSIEISPITRLESNALSIALLHVQHYSSFYRFQSRLYILVSLKEKICFSSKPWNTLDIFEDTLIGLQLTVEVGSEPLWIADTCTALGDQGIRLKGTFN